DMLHVPFRTSPELATAVMGKQVDLLFDTVPAVLGMVRSGQLKALAVTGDERFPAVPDVPTVKESGALPGYVVSTWYGLVAPRRQPYWRNSTPHCAIRSPTRTSATSSPRPVR